MTINLLANWLSSVFRSLMTAMMGAASRPLKCRRLAGLMVPMVASAFGGAAHAAIISQYSFTDAVAGQLNRAATTVAANVTAGDITDAPLVGGNPAVALARTNDFYASRPVLSSNRRVDGPEQVFFAFDIAPNAGFELDLTSLDFNVSAGGGNPNERAYEIRTSADGFATSLTGGYVLIPTVRSSGTFTPVSIDLSAAQFQDLMSPLTFQIRFFTPTTFQNIDWDDFTLNGTVVPEPNALALLAITGVGAVLFRRRRRREVTAT